MASFTRNIVTNAGLRLFARADAGEVQVTFKRIVTSSFDYDAETDEELMALMTMDGIQQTKVPDSVTSQVDEDTGVNMVYARALIPNNTVTVPYNLHAYGLYADNPDDPGVESSEILVMISAKTIGTDPIYIPSFTTDYGLAVQPKFVIPLHRTENINFTVDPAGSVTQEDLESLRQLIISSNFPNKVWINNKSTLSIANGSVNFPYKSINAALAEHEGDQPIEFIIAAGNYNENITINNNHSFFLNGVGAIGDQLVEISGAVDITSTSDNIGLANINFTGQLTCNSAAGGLYADNCHFDSFTSGTSAGGQMIFDYCSFENDIQLYGNPHIMCRLTNFGNNGILYMRASGMILETNECINVALNHQAGRYLCTGNTQFKQYGAGYAISSSASGANNPLLLYSGTTAQFDGSFARVNQMDSGCYYVIGSFIHSSVPGFDTFNGTRLSVGLQVGDIIDNNTYSGISPTSGLVKETLQLLDAQVASNNATLQQILTNTNTILTRVNTINTNVNTLLNNQTSSPVRRIARFTPTNQNGTNFGIAFTDLSKVSYTVNYGITSYMRDASNASGTFIRGTMYATRVSSISQTSVTINAGYGIYYQSGQINGIVDNLSTVEFIEYY